VEPLAPTPQKAGLRTLKPMRLTFDPVPLKLPFADDLSQRRRVQEAAQLCRA